MKAGTDTTTYNRMTTEPVEKLLVSLSIPTILSMMITSLYNLVDTAFVGTLGTSQSGATGIVSGYMAILQAVAFMCGQGCGSIMSRKLGEKNLDEATKFSSTGFFLSFSFGLMIAAFSFIFINPLIMFLGSTKTIAPYAKTYLIYILLSAPFFTSSLTMNNILRYEGKAKLGTIALLSGSVINIFGDALFMFVFKMGIAGAGLATAVSQTISFSILVYMFVSRRTQTRISPKYISRKFSTVMEILATGFPSMLRQGLNSIATMLLNRCSAVYGDQAVAAMSIVSRISFFPMAVAVGIGQGFQPISGFNYGAGKKDRVREAFFKAFVGAEIALFIISVPIFIYAGPVVGRLRDDIEVINIGKAALRYMCISQLFIPLTMMIEMGFQSTGQKLLATIGSSLRSGVVLMPALIILAKTQGLFGIQIAQPVSHILTFIICLFLLRIYLNKLKD